MFDEIRQRLSAVLRRFRTGGSLTDLSIQQVLREIRAALLEANVDYQVVNEFMFKVAEHAAGERLISGIRPEQKIVKILHDELIELLGPISPPVRFARSGPTIVMLCGLQGSGKTATCGKLARLFALQGRKPLLVAADVHRPSAIEELAFVGEELRLPVFSKAGCDPVQVCQNALVEAHRQVCDTILLDTAGPLHVDDGLNLELQQIEANVKPHQVFFISDAATGLHAVRWTRVFNDRLEIDAVILTKLDKDAHGGAAMSVRRTTGLPIKFICNGKELDKIEPFDSERLVRHMLGIDDIGDIVEAAQSIALQEEAESPSNSLGKAKFDLNDFREQIVRVREFGSIHEVLAQFLTPYQMSSSLDEIDARRRMKRFVGIIDGMTPEERRSPQLMSLSRRRRVSAGSGVTQSDVLALFDRYVAMSVMVKAMSKRSMS